MTRGQSLRLCRPGTAMTPFPCSSLVIVHLGSKIANILRTLHCLHWLSGSVGPPSEFHTYQTAADVYQKNGFGTAWTPNLEGFSRKEPQGTPRRPKGSQREPKGAPRHPKQGQRQHQRGTKGAQWRPRGTQRNPLAPTREFKGSLYTQKLPINRTSGHH